MIPSTYALLGTIRGSQGYLGLSASKFEFAAAFGGNVDLRLHDCFGIRLVQAEYMITPFLGLRQDNIRLSSGIVFYLGKKK